MVSEISGTWTANMPSAVAIRIERLQTDLADARGRRDLVRQELILKKLITEATDAKLRFRVKGLGGRVTGGKDLAASRAAVKQSQQKKLQFKDQLKLVRGLIRFQRRQRKESAGLGRGRRGL